MRGLTVINLKIDVAENFKYGVRGYLGRLLVLTSNMLVRPDVNRILIVSSALRRAQGSNKRVQGH